MTVPPNVLFEPYPKQQQFIEAAFSGDYMFLVYGGGRGGGKTKVCWAILMVLCRAYPKSVWYVIRRDLPRMKRSTIRDFRKWTPHHLYRWNGQDYTMTFRNGSQIVFMSENYSDDPEGNQFKGLPANGYVLEQVEELREDTLHRCFETRRRNQIDPMPPGLILATVNPTPNWVKERVYEAWRHGNLPYDWYYQPALIQDNPALANDESYLRGFEHLDELTRRQMLKGDWDAFSANDPFAYAFRETAHVSERAVYDASMAVHLSFDFNNAPATCVAVQYTSDWIRFIREFSSTNKGIEDLLDQILAAFPDASLTITGDASGWNKQLAARGTTIYNIIERYLKTPRRAMLAPIRNLDHKVSRVLVNSLLQNYPVNGAPEVLFHPSMKHTIQDFRLVEVDADGSIKKANRADPNQRADFLDCVRYALHTHFERWLKFSNLKERA